jgi:acetyl/propionyl-CoA carboxylase alpha subunit
LPNNIDFLVKCVRHKGFSKEQPTTAFFSQYMDGILQSLVPQPLADLNKFTQFGVVSFLQALGVDNGNNIWDGKGEFANWRANRTINRRLSLHAGEENVKVGVAIGKNTFSLAPEDSKSRGPVCKLIASKIVSDAFSEQNVRCVVLESTVDIEGHRVTGTTAIQIPPTGHATLDVWLDGQIGEDASHYHFSVQTKVEGAAEGSGSSHPLVISPMPGKIVKVHVADGATVKKGDAIAVLEAMKMEHIVYAPCDG